MNSRSQSRKKRAVRRGSIHSFLRTGGACSDIFEATFENDVEHLSQILELAWTDVIKQNGITGKTALHVACERGHYDVVKKVIEAGANPNVRESNDRRTPLMIASKWGRANIVKYLLKNGADATMRTRSRLQTSLHLAAFSNRYEVVEILVKECKNILNSFDINGRTALHIACATPSEKDSNEHKVAIAKTLIEHGAHWNKGDSDGRTPMHLACTDLTQNKLVDFFLSLCAGNDCTLEHCGKKSGEAREKEQDGAKITLRGLLNAKTRFGNKPLDVALSHKNFKIANELMLKMNEVSVIEKLQEEALRKKREEKRAKENASMEKEIRRIEASREDAVRLEKEAAAEKKRNEEEDMKRRELWGV